MNPRAEPAARDIKRLKHDISNNIDMIRTRKIDSKNSEHDQNLNNIDIKHH